MGSTSPSTGRDIFVMPAQEVDSVTSDEGPMFKKVSSIAGSFRDYFMLMIPQAKLDDDVEAVVRDIQDRYAPGKVCKDPKHGAVACFIHVPSNQHFDVSFRPRALQWAGKIVGIFFWLR